MRRAGPLATVQDLGRPGWQHLGVPVSGALDALALRLANLLVGNPEGAAALEVTLGGFEAEFTSDTRFAVVGPGGAARLNGVPVASWESHRAQPGDRLALGPTATREVIAVAGGVAVPEVLGSRSTYLRGGFGGFEGRALRAGDELPLGRPTGAPRGPVPGGLRPATGDPSPLRVVWGPQADRFTPEARAAFGAASYRVSERADRMGCVLEGPRLTHLGGADLVSEGIAPGSIQVPGDGLPLVLLADRPTVGGYTKIATVAGVDLPRLAQALPGAEVRFAPVTLWEARELWLWQEHAVARYRES